MSDPRFITPDTLPPTVGYSHVAIAAGPLVFTSGQVGFDPSGHLVDGGFEAQAVQAFENVKAALTAAGLDFSRVVKLNMFVTDIKTNLGTMRRVRDRYINLQAPPASTTVEPLDYFVDGILFEVDAIAVAK
jgi:enamine deaminase RidA (YjgF/YER057c/UK114 family)